MQAEKRGVGAAPTWEALQVGRAVGPIEHLVTPEMVDAFTHVMDGDAAKRAKIGDPMPPTLLATDYVLLLENVLHLGHGLMSRHETTIRRVVRIGERVTVAGRITDKFVRKQRKFWVLEYEVRNAGDEICIIHRICCSVN